MRRILNMHMHAPRQPLYLLCLESKCHLPMYIHVYVYTYIHTNVHITKFTHLCDSNADVYIHTYIDARECMIGPRRLISHTHKHTYIHGRRKMYDRVSEADIAYTQTYIHTYITYAA
jgi:hypothetical protein